MTSQPAASPDPLVLLRLRLALRALGGRPLWTQDFALLGLPISADPDEVLDRAEEILLEAIVNGVPRG